jgi:predicted MFS family arabinose efflux permease
MSAEGDVAAVDPSAPSPGGTLQALRDRNFLPFFLGNMLSSCGTWFHNIAQTLLVYRLTGSVFLVGVVNLAQFAGVFLLGSTAGVAADRFDRRHLLLVTQSASTVISALLAILAALDVVTVPVMMVAALLLGIAQTFSTPAILAMVPQLVPAPILAPAVALNIVTMNVARAVGPVLGAVVVDQFGVAAAFGLNSLSFLAVIAAMLVVRIQPLARRLGDARISLLDTIRSLRRRPNLAVLFVVAVLISMAIDPVTTLSPKFATDVFHQPDTLVGWCVGAFGFGAVIAGVVVSRQPIADDRLLAWRMAILVAAFATFATTGFLPLALAALVAAGFAYIGTAAAALTRVQRETEPTEHGRLMALWTMAFTGSRPIAGLIDGAVASATTVQVAAYVMIAPSVAGLALLTARVRAAPQPA